MDISSIASEQHQFNIDYSDWLQYIHTYHACIFPNLDDTQSQAAGHRSCGFHSESTIMLNDFFLNKNLTQWLHRHEMTSESLVISKGLGGSMARSNLGDHQQLSSSTDPMDTACRTWLSCWITWAKLGSGWWWITMLPGVAPVRGCCVTWSQPGGAGCVPRMGQPRRWCPPSWCQPIGCNQDGCRMVHSWCNPRSSRCGER